jgi:hypothetical protein
LTINGSLASGGVATFDAARRVIVTSVGNDSGINFAVSGENYQGQVITDTFAGATSGAAQSNMDFKAVTAVTTSAATATNVTVGTNAVASSQWIPLDTFQNAVDVGVNVNVTGTVNYTVDATFDDVFATTIFTTPAQVVAPTATNLIAASTDQYGHLQVPYSAIRLTRNSGNGTVAFTAIQACGRH